MISDIWLQAFAMKAGKIIRDARNERGWSQAELGRRVGISQPAVMKIEKGVTTKSKHFPKIAQVLNLELSDLDSSLSPLGSHTETKLTSTMKKPQVERVKQEYLMGADNLPVFSLAQGGPGALVLSNVPFRTIGRPHNLQTIEDAFGVQIAGDSMFPEYREGDIAYVDPHALPRIGDACLFQSDRHGTVEAVIKYLDKSPQHSSEVWHVRQQTPEKRYTLKKEEWQKCYVLVGKQTGR